MTPIEPDLEIGLREEIEDLRRALESRAVIEQAKGILMTVYRIDEARAFSILKRWSMHSNLKLRTLAVALIDVHVHGHDPDDEARTVVASALGTSGCARITPLAVPVLLRA